MDRARAVLLLKKLLVRFGELQLRSFALTSNSPNALSQDYKVHIIDNLDAYTVEGIKELTQKHGLTLTEKHDRLIIYSPIEAENNLLSSFPLCLKTDR